MSKEYPWRDKDRLRRKYNEQGKSMAKIAEEWDTYPATINRWTEKHGIETRDETDRSPEVLESKEHTQEAWLREQYHGQEKSLSEIADIAPVNRPTILYWMRKHAIKTRDRKEESIKRSRIERATFSHKAKGYEIAESYNRLRDKPDEVLIHRLCAVAWFGLEEVKDNVVHHEIPIPWLNTERNLNVMTASEHSRLHETADRYN